MRAHTLTAISNQFDIVPDSVGSYRILDEENGSVQLFSVRCGIAGLAGAQNRLPATLLALLEGGGGTAQAATSSQRRGLHVFAHLRGISANHISNICHMSNVVIVRCMQFLYAVANTWLEYDIVNGGSAAGRGRRRGVQEPRGALLGGGGPAKSCHAGSQVSHCSQKRDPKRGIRQRSRAKVTFESL